MQNTTQNKLWKDACKLFFSNTDIDYVHFQVDPNTEQYRAGM